MAIPTTNEAIATLKAAVDMLEELDQFANANSPNLVGLQDTLINSLTGDNAAGILANGDAMRSAIAGQLTPSRDRSTLTPCFSDFMAAILIPSSSLGENLVQFRAWMIANSQTLNSRGMGFGTIAVGGSNVGTGTISRITVDNQAIPLEGGHAELKSFECIADQGQTEETEEVSSPRCERSRRGTRRPTSAILPGRRSRERSRQRARKWRRRRPQPGQAGRSATLPR